MVRKRTIRITRHLSIPEDEIDFRFSRSSGPGGQHANRSATKVELLFDVARSPSLAEDQRAQIMERLRHHIDSDGVLHLTSESTRSQWRNRVEVLRRFRSLLQDALKPVKRRRKSQPSLSSRIARLESKRHRSRIKRLRRPVRPDED